MPNATPRSLGARGEMRIPKPIRDKMKLEKGQTVMVSYDEQKNEIVIRKLQVEE